MSDGPENLTLRPLHEIWDAWKDHGQSVDRIEQRIDEAHETMYTVAGFAMHADVHHDSVTNRLKVLEERVGRLEEKA